ncbi:ABC transporter permease [Agaribacterium sp. ZY112]|uniref:ABC transporter permease n=1 Tax=Agaribacterium sp. ZY112 TaxID=3233574 RepID=UPI0035258D3E
MKRLINLAPSRPFSVLLAILPFAVLVVLYIAASDARLAENANDKLLPSIAQFSAAIERMAFEPSKRTGEYLLWVDTAASLWRLFQGVMISALMGLIFGACMGLFPYARSAMSPLFVAISLIPPMAILPILFIVFGLGEVSKVVLIVIGIAPFIIRDMQARVLELPKEQLIKAQTLGANSWQILVRVVLPQIMPRLIALVSLSLGAAWLFLIAGEAIAAQEGLGYRIFLVRRYMAMDVILPYVAWITFLAFITDYALKQLSRKSFPWFHALQGAKS